MEQGQKDIKISPVLKGGTG